MPRPRTHRKLNARQRGMVRRVARTALHTYDRVQGHIDKAVGSVAGIPSKILHSVVDNPSIFDYEDATRRGRERGTELYQQYGGPIKFDDSVIEEQFSIWWIYGPGMSQATPNDRAGNLRAYKKAFKEATSKRGRRSNGSLDSKANPRGEDLTNHARTARSVEELGRLHRYAISHGDGALQSVVEERAAQLGMRLGEVRGAHPRQWANPANPTQRLYLDGSLQLSETRQDADGQVHGPFRLASRGTPVEIHQRGRGGHRLLVEADYYGTQLWGWADKDRVLTAKKFHAAHDYYPAASPEGVAEKQRQIQREVTGNPRKAALTRWLPAGQKVVINDAQRVNAPGVVVNWDGARDTFPGSRHYGQPDRAVVKMLYFGNEVLLPHHVITAVDDFDPTVKRSLERRGVKVNPSSPPADWPWPGEWQPDLTQDEKIFAYAIGHSPSNYPEPVRSAGIRKIREIMARDPERTARVIDERKQRYNPAVRSNPQEQADYVFEKFHGEPPDESVIVEEQIHEHEHLAVLGTLICIVVETPTGYLMEQEFDGKDAPYLCVSEDCTQLYIEGGDQRVDLAKIKMDTQHWVKDRMVLGQFAEPRKGAKWNITYRTAKDFDQFEEIDYQHDLGEETGERPYLEYEPRSEKLYISGGQYFIKLPFTGTSPGIEN